MSLYKKKIIALLLTMFCNLIFGIAKIMTGRHGNSFALVADGFESFIDVISSIFIIVALYIAQIPPDKEHPYGHGRSESLATFITIGFLTITGYEIVLHAAQKLTLGISSTPELYTLYLLGPIIITKEILIRYLNKIYQKDKSLLIQSEAVHQRSDSMISIAVFIGIALSIAFPHICRYADSIAALLAGLGIFFNGYQLLKPTLYEIMDKQTDENLLKDIRNIAESVGGVVSTEKCFIRKMGVHYYVDLHIIVHGQLTVVEGHTIAHRVKQTLLVSKPELLNILIHVEPTEQG